jgi:hypothetical protein
VLNLKLTQLRSRIYRGNTAQRDAMTRVAAATGARFTCNLGQPGQKPTPADMVAWLETFPAGVVAIIEGNNEPNLQLGADWVALTRKWMTDLAAALKASKQAWVRALPLLAPALGKRTGYEALGPLPMCGLGNLHIATSEKAAGTYVPKVILENALRGVLGAYLYELVDNPANPDGTDSEAHFGLLRADWTAKPAYTTLNSLGDLIADSAAPPNLDGVQVGITGPQDLVSLLLARSDGTHQVVLWRRVEVWDRVTQKDVGVAPLPVSVRFAKAVKLGARALGPGEAIDAELAESVLVHTVKVG